MIIVYPALFTRTKDYYLIEIPDLNIYTQSIDDDDLAHAIHMARDAIGLRCVCLENDKEKLPEPSLCLDTAQGKFSSCGETLISYIDVDLLQYRRQLAGLSISEKEFKENLSNFLNSTIESHQILHINCKSGNAAVILSEQDYNGLLEAAYLRTLFPG